MSVGFNAMCSLFHLFFIKLLFHFFLCMSVQFWYWPPCWKIPTGSRFWWSLYINVLKYEINTHKWGRRRHFDSIYYTNKRIYIKMSSSSIDEIKKTFSQTWTLCPTTSYHSSNRSDVPLLTSDCVHMLYMYCKLELLIRIVEWNATSSSKLYTRGVWWYIYIYIYIVLVIPIRTGRYLENKITLEVNDRTCILHSVWGLILRFYSGLCYLLGINRIACYIFKRKPCV